MSELVLNEQNGISVRMCTHVLYLYSFIQNKKDEVSFLCLYCPSDTNKYYLVILILAHVNNISSHPGQDFVEISCCTAPYINNIKSCESIFLLFLWGTGEYLQEPLYLLAGQYIKLKIVKRKAGLVVQAKNYTRSGFGMHFKDKGVANLLKITCQPPQSLCFVVLE